MWELMDKEAQLNYMVNRTGIPGTKINHEMIAEAEYMMNRPQRDKYTDYCSSYVADVAYREVDPEHESAANVFYFHMMRIPLEVRAKMIWHTMSGVQP
jgi:hypothetical protein